MKPLFTIHGGEYLFANELESRFPTLHLWLPGKDVGVDFLITDEQCKKPLTIQVKYSRDFNWTHNETSIREHIKSFAWYSLKSSKMENSTADYWVLVNYDGFRRAADFLFVQPADLLNRFQRLDRTGERMECYITITNDGKAYETRTVKKKDMHQIVNGSLDGSVRDFTPYYNKWEVIQKHFKLKHATT